MSPDWNDKLIMCFKGPIMKLIHFLRKNIDRFSKSSDLFGAKALTALKTSSSETWLSDSLKQVRGTKLLSDKSGS